MNRLSRANVVALALPAALIAGALGSQYIGGLYPCEMCLWQRWPHYAAIALAGAAFFASAPIRGVMTALAAFAILSSGAIGAFHAGVEYGWWPGITKCASAAVGTSLKDLLSAPLIRCDVAPWTFGGISLAGYNALFSGIGALAILTMIRSAK